MLSAGPCQRVMWKMRLTNSRREAAIRRLKRGPREKGSPPIVKVWRRLLSRNVVSHWTPMTNPFETSDITKPKDMPHKMPPPITFTSVTIRSKCDCVCEFTASMGNSKALYFRYFSCQPATPWLRFLTPSCCKIYAERPKNRASANNSY